MIQLRPTNTDQTGRTYHEPVLTQIVGVSQYNSNQFRLQNVEGFWETRQGQDLPPHNVLAWFTLTTKPKGGNAAPGSVYRDIHEVVKATDQDRADYASQPQQQTPWQADSPRQEPDWGSPTPAAPAASPATPAPSNVEQRILQGMAFNNLTVALAAGKTSHIADGVKRLADIVGQDPVEVWAQLAAAALAGDPLPLVLPVDEADTSEPEPEDVTEEVTEEQISWE